MGAGGVYGVRGLAVLFEGGSYYGSVYVGGQLADGVGGYAGAGQQAGFGDGFPHPALLLFAHWVAGGGAGYY